MFGSYSTAFMRIGSISNMAVKQMLYVVLNIIIYIHDRKKIVMFARYLGISNIPYEPYLFFVISLLMQMQENDKYLQ